MRLSLKSCSGMLKIIYQDVTDLYTVDSEVFRRIGMLSLGSDK